MLGWPHPFDTAATRWRLNSRPQTCRRPIRSFFSRWIGGWLPFANRGRDSRTRSTFSRGSFARRSNRPARPSHSRFRCHASRLPRASARAAAAARPAGAGRHPLRRRPVQPTRQPAPTAWGRRVERAPPPSIRSSTRPRAGCSIRSSYSPRPLCSTTTTWRIWRAAWTRTPSSSLPSPARPQRRWCGRSPSGCCHSWNTPTSRVGSGGYCPICGAWPLLGELRGVELSRFSRCAGCGAGWRARPARLSVLRQRRLPHAADADRRD